MAIMDGGRQDLAAMIAPLQRALIAAELPVLRAHGLSMWGYVVLNAVDGEPVRTQAALAEFIGADKSRIIGVGVLRSAIMPRLGFLLKTFLRPHRVANLRRTSRKRGACGLWGGRL